MDRTWNHYSLPPRVDFCRVEEVDPALVGDSHQLLRHLAWTRRRSLSSVYKYHQSCTSKGSGGYSPKKLKLNKCAFCRDVHRGSVGAAGPLWPASSFGGLRGKSASLIMINVSLLPLRVCVRLHLCQAVTRRLPTPPRSDQGREEEAFIWQWSSLGKAIRDWRGSSYFAK